MIMNKIFLFLLTVLPISLCAQSSSKIEEVKEVSLSKNELFSKAKIFISDKWNNPKHSIQSEDKEN